MLLAQNTSQLDKQLKDEFWKTLFPSGNVKERDVAMQTAAELDIKEYEKESKPISEAPKPINSEAHKPIGEAPKWISRRERRHNESMKARLEKQQKQQEKQMKEKQREIDAKLAKIAECKKIIPEHLKRIIGI